MLKAYQNIWFCGLAASGKTTLLRFLSNKLKGIEYLNDSLEMVEFIRKDKNKDLKKSSLFIYVYSPFEERLKRNQQRSALNNKITSFESFRCPQEAMNRFFMEDDFFQAIKEHPVDVFFIPNLYSLKYLKHKVEMLFFNDLTY